MFGVFNGIFAQELLLNVTGKDSLETTVLNKVEFKKKHADFNSLKNEISVLQKRLQHLGYFTNYVENLSQIESNYFASFSLGPKVEFVQILIEEPLKKKYRNFYFSDRDSIRLKPAEVAEFLQSVMNEFDKQGRSFTEIRLETLALIDKEITTYLKIKESKERSIDKVVIKGYENFPRSFLEKFFKIKSKKNFSKDRLKEISSLTKSLDFVEEIKPPEVLFKQDSTLLYLFLKRVKTSSVDGIINFASKEDGSGILINGNLDLKLNNVINTGEKIEIFWNRVKEENSEFRFGSEIPFLFNSDLSVDLSFAIYRQDSTFLNTSFNSKLNYQLTPNSKVYITYQSDDSDYLLNDPSLNFETFSANYYGFGYSFLSPSSDVKFNRKYAFELFPSFGKRDKSNQSLDQIKVLFNAEANISVSSRSYVNIKNATSFLKSDNYLTNELFRIGGANSLRGFNEQSIFTNKFSYLNVEYRYLTSINSYLHSITDFGLYENVLRNRDESALGLGIGYVFALNSNIVNLGYAIGITQNNGVDLNNSQIIIKWNSTF